MADNKLRLIEKVKKIIIAMVRYDDKLSKTKRLKELIIFGKLSLTEIASKLHYNSVAHLSNKF